MRIVGNISKVKLMNLYEYRRLNFITVKQASEELGISRQHIYDIEKGKSFPSRKLCMKISRWSNGLITEGELLFPDLTKSANGNLVSIEGAKRKGITGVQIMMNETYRNEYCSDKVFETH